MLKNASIIVILKPISFAITLIIKYSINREYIFKKLYTDTYMVFHLEDHSTQRLMVSLKKSYFKQSNMRCALLFCSRPESAVFRFRL